MNLMHSLVLANPLLAAQSSRLQYRKQRGVLIHLCYILCNYCKLRLNALYISSFLMLYLLETLENLYKYCVETQRSAFCQC